VSDTTGDAQRPTARQQKIRTTLRCVSLLFAACITNLFCAAQIIGIHSYFIDEDGSSPRINTLYKHSQGYLLAGTATGLYRFDGNKFTPYLFHDSVKNKAVTAICEDKDHKVWVGMQNGEIAFLQNKAVQLLKAEEGHPSVAITAIKADTMGVIFFATAGEGIYYYRNKRFFNINTDDGLSDDYVYDLLITQTAVIAGTDRGINNINIEGNKKQISTYTSKDGLADNIVRCLYPDNELSSKFNRCYIGMQDKGIGMYSLDSAYKSSMGLDRWKYGQVNSLITANDQLWAATEDQGIVLREYNKQLNNYNVSAFNNSFQKAGNLIHDHEGNIWLTSDTRLIKTSGTQLQNIVPLSAELYGQVHTTLIDHAGNIWVNVNNGLLKFFFDTLTGKMVSKRFRLPLIDLKTDITCLYEDKFGNIWAGTLGKGVMIIDPVTGKSRHLDEQNLLGDGSILSINGKGNQVWISSLGGAVNCTLSNDNEDINHVYQFTNYSNVSGIGSNYIYSILVDSKNRVWFATDGKGITVYDNVKFSNYNQEQGIKSLVVYSVCEDQEGNIWFSTATAGIYKFDGKKFINFSVKEGLNDATITSLTTDAKGNIVAISKKGVNIIDTKTNSITYLDANQGLEELNTDLNCITSDDSNVYFVSKVGIIRYTPSYETTTVKLVLDNVQLFLNPIDVNAKSTFAYDENNFSFSFSGISFSHPEKIRYQYKLEGLSNNWINTKDNSINFPKLPPGTYTFRVRVSLNSNFENSTEQSYRFIISKPLWLQWWFVILALLVCALALYYFVKQREKRVKHWERLEKEKIQSQFETLKSQVNPHFLFNSFNTLISVIEENPGNAVEYVEHLSDLYRKIVTYRDKDLISLNEELQLINDYFFIQKKRFGNHLRIVNNITPGQATHNMIAPLTLQLLAENAVKHNAMSSETPLIITINIEQSFLVIANNINPKRTPEKGEGMGLQNIQKRYQLLSKMDVRIEKTNTDFKVYVPLLTAK
jgi:ligand-binding sensor domain-containing protein